MADRYVKTNGNDANPGTSLALAFQTIQKGIDDCAATGGGTVLVAHGYYGELVKMRSDVALIGVGPAPGAAPIEAPQFEEEDAGICPDKPVLDGQGGGTVIACAGIAHAKVDNFNIVRGSGSNNDNGGGVYIQGEDIAIEACCIVQNAAAEFGGGVCVDARSTGISFKNDLFWFNAADAGGALAIIESRNVKVIDSTFIENANLSTQGKGGGAIHVGSSSGVSVVKSTFTVNRSDDLGGAILVDDCSAIIPAVVLSECRFTANSTKISGAGIMVTQTSFISVDDCEFIDNKADRDGGGIGFNNRGLPGGGAFNPTAVRAAGQVSRISNCRFTANAAGDDGGGVYLTAATMAIVSDCKFVRNLAQENGGGLHCTFGSAVDIADCTFEHNLAGTANGGGVSLRNADLTMTDTKFSHDVARQGMGGGVYICTESSIRWYVFLRRWGFITRGSTVAISGCEFADCFARSGGGAIASRAPSYPIAATTKACSFQNNRVQNAGLGGAVYLDRTSATIVDNTFDRNQVFMLGNAARGGAVAGVECPSFAMSGGRVEHCRAGLGGGVSLQGIANPSIAGTTFNQNFVTTPGGSGADIHAQACAGVSANALLAANPGTIPGEVVVVP